MLRLILRKTIWAFISLWAIVTVAYACLYLLPGDPARIILGPQASSESILRFRHSERLDQPWVNQYEHYLLKMARMDFGFSFSQRRPVGDLLAQRSGATLNLMVVAALFSLICGMLLPLALKTMLWEKPLSAMGVAFQLFAFVPPYVLAITALLILSYQLQWIPVVFASNQLASLVVAAAVLSAYPAALLLKVFVERLGNELKQPYALRARAHGFSRSHQLWRETLPNALPAAFAVFANSLAFFVTGAFFVEVVFGVPGLGRLAQAAIDQKDIPLLSGVCLEYAFFVLVVSLALDMTSVLLSPRAIEYGT